MSVPKTRPRGPIRPSTSQKEIYNFIAAGKKSSSPTQKRVTSRKEEASILYGARPPATQEQKSLQSVPSDESLLKMKTLTTESSQGGGHVVRRAMFSGRRVLEGARGFLVEKR